MDKIDSELEAEGDQCVEYIFTKPKWSLFLKFLFSDMQSSVNPYGHSAIRYIDPDTGEDTVMNVCGQKGKKLINFIPTHEYLFTDVFHEGNEQGGVFNRSFLGVRIENVPKEKMRELHNTYKELLEKQDKGEIKFFLLPLSFFNPIRRLLGLPMVGNCSHWTTIGLKKVGLLPRTYNWPLLVYFELIRAQMANKFKSLNIVSYLGLTYPVEPAGSFIYPFFWFKQGYAKIWQLDDLSNLLIALETSGMVYGDRAKFNREAKLALLGDKKSNLKTQTVSLNDDSLKADKSETESETFVNQEKDSKKGKDNQNILQNTVISEESFDIEDAVNQEAHKAIILKQKHIKDRFDEIKEKFKFIFRDD